MRNLIVLLFSTLVAVYATLAMGGETLPNLVISGFSWAENLVFDGYGSLFVCDSVRGEIWKINLCKNGSAYCSQLQLTDGLSSVGGMQIPPDGQTIYAGATLDDGKTHVLISTEAHPVGKASYKILAQTKFQPNGVAADWSSNVLYYTFEGRSNDPGALMKFDLNTNVETTAYPGLGGADGAWFDENSKLLYVGLLTDKTVKVFNTSVGVTDPAFLVGTYPALSSLDKTHMLDDLTLFDPAQGFSSNTVLLGADWLGSAVRKFDLAGNSIVSIPPPAGVDKFYQITSVRWGKGPGFDPNSVYVTEGGGMLDRQTNRRVIQIKMK
jgi:sugar lactone lactonase YvrE